VATNKGETMNLATKRAAIDKEMDEIANMLVEFDKLSTPSLKIISAISIIVKYQQVKMMAATPLKRDTSQGMILPPNWKVKP
jgi:hypothetical protein